MSIAMDKYMEHAFRLAKKADPFPNPRVGAVLVKNGRIIGKGYHKKAGKPHAEIEAIRDACRNLKTNDLRGCELYSTSKPCRMCETAGYWANIYRFYFGANIVDGGAPQYSAC